MESELSLVRKEVADLKVRHEQELSDLKRDHDLRNAVLNKELEQRLQDKERSIEERAMQRVDAVTKKTIMLNQRCTLEIQNLHKEIGDLQRVNDRLAEDNQQLRFDVDIKQGEVKGVLERISEIKGVLSQQLVVNEGHAEQESVWRLVSDRGDKHTLVLQMMVKTLEDRVAAQAKQIAHYQQREVDRSQARGGTAKSLPLSLPLLPMAVKNRGLLNFVNIPGRAPEGSMPATRRPSPRQHMASPRQHIAGSKRAQVNRPVVSGHWGKDAVQGEVSRDEVISLLLASVDDNPTAGASSEGVGVHQSGAVTHR